MRICFETAFYSSAHPNGSTSSINSKSSSTKSSTSTTISRTTSTTIARTSLVLNLLVLQYYNTCRGDHLASSCHHFEKMVLAPQRLPHFVSEAAAKISETSRGYLAIHCAGRGKVRFKVRFCLVVLSCDFEMFVKNTSQKIVEILRFIAFCIRTSVCLCCG